MVMESLVGPNAEIHAGPGRDRVGSMEPDRRNRLLVGQLQTRRQDCPLQPDPWQWGAGHHQRLDWRSWRTVHPLSLAPPAMATKGRTTPNDHAGGLRLKRVGQQ